MDPTAMRFGLNPLLTPGFSPDLTPIKSEPDGTVDPNDGTSGNAGNVDGFQRGTGTTLPAIGGNQGTIGGLRQPNLGAGLRTKKSRSTQTDYQKRSDGVMNRYTDQLRSIFHRDAQSLARGHQPITSYDQLDDDGKKALEKATVDMLLDMPLGSFSPAMANRLGSWISGISSHDIRNAPNKSLRDLGAEGKHIVRAWRRDSPVAFYSACAALAGGAVAYGYAEGSKGLEKIGLKPEISQRFFGGRIKAKARFAWDKEFANFRLHSGSLSGKTGLWGNNTLSGQLKLGEYGRYQQGGLRLTIPSDQLTLSYGFNHNVEDNTSVLDTTLRWSMMPGMSNSFSYGHDFINRTDRFSLGMQFQPSKELNLNTSLSYVPQTDHSTASLEMRHRLPDNWDFALSGSHDSKSESRIGFAFVREF